MFVYFSDIDFREFNFPYKKKHASKHLNSLNCSEVIEAKSLKVFAFADSIGQRCSTFMTLTTAILGIFKSDILYGLLKGLKNYNNLEITEISFSS